MELGKRPRPDTIDSKTYRIETGCGHLYVIIGWDDVGLFEVFAFLGKSGGCAHAEAEGLTRAISRGLRYGVPPEEFIKQMEGIQCPNPVFFPKGKEVLSCPAGIGMAIATHLAGKDSV